MSTRLTILEEREKEILQEINEEQDEVAHPFITIIALIEIT